MTISERLLVHEYFPRPADEIPFGDMLNSIFFHPPQGGLDYPLHGPNVIRFVEALVDCNLRDSGILREDYGEARREYHQYYPKILEAMGIDSPAQARRVTDLLKVAALYHDIGKCIRRENHPLIGANLIRNFDENQRKDLVDLLVYDNDPATGEAKHNRFTLISSIIQHHDKFGVVNTGEGALPIFSDILYFAGDKSDLEGIKKNVTSVMLLNLADIASVIPLDEKTLEQASKIAANVGKLRRDESRDEEFADKNENKLLTMLQTMCKESDTCMGLPLRKVERVLSDWNILINAIDDVRGDRVQLKVRLMELERNPSRSIRRIHRLLQETSETTNAGCLKDYITPTSVEAVLVGILGAHQFQTFCERLATVVKFDYGLPFFEAVFCACVRKEIHTDYKLPDNIKWEASWRKLKDSEPDEVNEVKKLSHDRKSEITGKITTLFVRILESLITRYEGVLDYTSSNPRRFGFQMRNLTGDEKIRDTIIDFLCLKDYKDPIALKWIADEVTIWSLD